MTDPTSYYYRTNTTGTMTPTHLDLDPPRPRIAVACNRCRRRKIKCSGSLEGQSCDACIRANNTECVFADRLPLSKSSPEVENLNSPSRTTTRLQPPAPTRSSSLPTTSQGTERMPKERDFRLPLVDVREHSIQKPLNRTQSSSSSNDQMSPPSLPKRQSASAASHPYSRPASAGARKTSSDQISTNLMRYSQSLVQGQAQQLSGRTQHVRTQPGFPTSFPAGYTFGHNALQQQHMKQRPVPYQIQTTLMSSPVMSHHNCDMPTLSSPTYPASFTTADYGPYARGEIESPTSVCYSPMFQPSMYSPSTPDLVSSDSISTLDSHPSMTGKMDQMSRHNSIYANHSYINLDSSSYQNIPLVDPNQWTPGTEKIASQWLQFSPRQDGGLMNTFEQLQQHA